jgi:hypothetical protein
MFKLSFEAERNSEAAIPLAMSAAAAVRSIGPVAISGSAERRRHASIRTYAAIEKSSTALRTAARISNR